MTLKRTHDAIDSIKKRISTPITRFAPSPTGFLHLGHVAHMIYLWGIARSAGSQILLRMEDHDRTRCKPVFEDTIFDDLKWLGLDWDNRSFGIRCESTPFRQSNCIDLYEHLLSELSKKGLTYFCKCSRKDIQQKMNTLPKEFTEQFYSGTCRTSKLEDSKNHGIRVTLDKSVYEFEDLYLGVQAQAPADQCGDFLIKDRNGNFTYQFAVVADDLRHQVNLIIRGQDLTSSTGRQLAARSLLGENEQPLYFHHPLINDEEGKKLSKRGLSEAISKRRENGEAPETVLGEAASLLGLIDRNAKISTKDLLGIFRK
jgi:glutamyl-Q tRNA(Asp) synthetase